MTEAHRTGQVHRLGDRADAVALTGVDRHGHGLLAQSAQRVLVTHHAEAGLGSGQVHPADPACRQRSASSAVARPLSALRMIVRICTTRMRRPAAAASGDPLGDPVRDGRHHVVPGEPARQVQLGGVTQLRVHDAVGREVLDGLRRHPAQVVGPLHHRDGVRERGEVVLQRAGRRRSQEPRLEAFRVGGGQRVADLVGQLEHRRGPDTTVEMVVQQHLRQGGDLVEVQVGCAHPPSVVRARA